MTSMSINEHGMVWILFLQLASGRVKDAPFTFINLLCFDMYTGKCREASESTGQA